MVCSWGGGGVVRTSRWYVAGGAAPGGGGGVLVGPMPGSECRDLVIFSRLHFLLSCTHLTFRHYNSIDHCIIYWGRVIAILTFSGYFCDGEQLQ